MIENETATVIVKDRGVVVEAETEISRQRERARGEHKKVGQICESFAGKAHRQVLVMAGTETGKRIIRDRDSRNGETTTLNWSSTWRDCCQRNSDQEQDQTVLALDQLEGRAER